ncbi:hypothetical protein KY284_010679 [Solanum tuberosum]|nr:hypothetical protein KY284_010679 [Solanum tuberosum]
MDQAIKNNKEPTSTNGNISQQPHTRKNNKTNHNNDDRPYSSLEIEDTKQHPHNQNKASKNTITTHNTYIDKTVQDQANSQEEEQDKIIEYNPAHEEQNGNESGKVLPLPKSQTSPTVQNAKILSVRKEYNQASKTTCIDSMLHIPKLPHENLLLAMTDEVEGGKDGGVQEKRTNLQEGVSKGEKLTHDMHENKHSDPSCDLRAPATTTHNQTNQAIQKEKGRNKKELKVKDTSQDKIDETSQVQNSPGTPNMITGYSGVQ